MDTFTRRSFLVASAGAAGTAALLATPTLAGASTDTRNTDKRTDGGTLSADTVLYVRDAKKGEVVILSGENEIVVTSRDLVGAIAKAANGKK